MTAQQPQREQSRNQNDEPLFTYDQVTTAICFFHANGRAPTLNEMRGGIPLFARQHTPAPSDEEKIDAAITFACEKHDAAIVRAATLAAYDKFMEAVEFRFDDTNNGRGIVGVIREIKDKLRRQVSRNEKYPYSV